MQKNVNSKTVKLINLPQSALEGIFIGGFAAFLALYLWVPYSYLLTGYYTALRLGKINSWIFKPFIFIGSLSVGLFAGEAFHEVLLFAVDMVVVSLAVLAAYHLSYWANFFATQQVSSKSFWLTCFWAVISSVVIYLVDPSPVVVAAVPLLWASLIPLWCFDLRLLHAPLFTVVYLFFFWLCTAILMPGLHQPLFEIYRPGYWLAAILLSLVPELFPLLHPERRHVPESRPVTSSPLSDWEKFVGLKEVLMLALGFYSMYMDKFPLVRRIAPLGRYLIIAGMLLELYPLLGGHSPLSPWYSLLPAAVGIMLELALENYGVFALWTLQYSLAMGLVRIFMTPSGSTGTIMLAAFLLFLALVVWFNRPAGGVSGGSHWKKRGCGSGEERVGL
ncbi:hypothetical protein DCCM_2142 [Desulfocucumis palustris]|uniref:Uncharacterized protein n=1 Tax=Desulfocucumis palustris TaxID=1898651 RepID=A0A2L2XA17_9FIRM|nr:hypothetical protein [Desulfocucumis palustris]GBF33045.1 hypothetical protein DCCM_2142 [Desulfocucumis palustris]